MARLCTQSKQAKLANDPLASLRMAKKRARKQLARPSQAARGSAYYHQAAYEGWQVSLVTMLSFLPPPPNSPHNSDAVLAAVTAAATGVAPCQLGHQAAGMNATGSAGLTACGTT